MKADYERELLKKDDALTRLEDDIVDLQLTNSKQKQKIKELEKDVDHSSKCLHIATNEQNVLTTSNQQLTQQLKTLRDDLSYQNTELQEAR